LLLILPLILPLILSRRRAPLIGSVNVLSRSSSVPSPSEMNWAIHRTLMPSLWVFVIGLFGIFSSGTVTPMNDAIDRIELARLLRTSSKSSSMCLHPEAARRYRQEESSSMVVRRHSLMCGTLYFGSVFTGRCPDIHTPVWRAMDNDTACLSTSFLESRM